MKNRTLDALAALLSRGSAKTARKNESSDQLRTLEEKFTRRNAQPKPRPDSAAPEPARASSDGVRWMS